MGLIKRARGVGGASQSVRGNCKPLVYRDTSDGFRKNAPVYDAYPVR